MIVEPALAASHRLFWWIAKDLRPGTFLALYAENGQVSPEACARYQRKAALNAPHETRWALSAGGGKTGAGTRK